MHPNKKVDLAAIERILGSVAFRNFVRSIILTKSETEDSTRIVHAKWNLSTRGKDLLFTKINRREESSPRGQYIGIDWQATDENIDPATAFDRMKLTNDDQSAAQWLRDHLSDHEWHKYDDVIAEGGRRSHTDTAIKQAKYRSNSIIHKEEGFGRDRITWWKLKR